MRIYFAGSIRAGREDSHTYHELIDFLKGYGQVLTEHVGLDDVESRESSMGDDQIFLRDIGWIQECEIFIAEVTLPSFGVGYETATAESLGKPVILLYRDGAEHGLSAMASGNDRLRIITYKDVADAKKKLMIELLAYSDEDM